jgi:hypothetical protein
LLLIFIVMNSTRVLLDAIAVLSLYEKAREYYE